MKFGTEGNGSGNRFGTADYLLDAYRPRLCENASANHATRKSTSQIALYSTIDPSGIPNRPP